MNTTPSVAFISNWVAGLHTPSGIPAADITMCVLIDGHALIQSLGCQTFEDLAVALQHVDVM